MSFTRPQYSLWLQELLFSVYSNYNTTRWIGLSLRKEGIDLRLFQVVVLVDKVTIRQVLLPELRFPLPGLFHQCSTFIFILLLLLE